MAVLPYADDTGRRRRRFPFVTLGLIVANVAVFVYELTLPQRALATLVQAWGVVPAEILSGSDLPPTIPAPVYLTLLTALFIHGGFLHVAGNLLYLWVFGDNLEDALGHGTYLLFYLAIGVIAGLFNVLLLGGSTTPNIGASGAIAGVLAGYLVLYPRAQVRSLLLFGPFLTVGRAAALVLIGAWFVLQLGQGLASLGAPAEQGGVAYFAHVGGFVAGLVLVPTIRLARGQRAVGRPGGVLLGPVFRNWIILVATLVVALAGASQLEQMGAGPAALVLRVAIVAGAAAIALVDAWRRIAGQPSFLGSGTGLGRVLAFVQLLAVILALAALALTSG